MSKLFSKNRNKLDLQFLKDQIKSTKFERFGKLTFCIIEVENGYLFTGQSSCVDINNYDKAIGESIAEENAIDSMWSVYGFALAQHLYEMAK